MTGILISAILGFAIALIFIFQYAYSGPLKAGAVDYATLVGTEQPAARFLRRCNWVISKLNCVPVFIRVYAIGIVETLAIVLYKRGVLTSVTRDSNENIVNEIVQQYRCKARATGRNPKAIIVGGDSGIGLEITRGLLNAGFHVTIASRNTELADNAKRTLQKESDGCSLSSLTVDLTDMDSVRAFADTVKHSFAKGEIDVLINNAGIMNTAYMCTKDGLESQCQTNYIAPFSLALLLLPWINRQTGRILFAASSTAYAISDMDLSVPKQAYSWDGLSHYAYSKRCVTLLTQHLAEKLASHNLNIKVHCYHPGTVRTKLFSHTTVFTLPLLSYIFDIIMLTPREGSITPLYLCLMPLAKNVKNGSYWADTVQQQLPPAKIQNTLWKITLEHCGMDVSKVDAIFQACADSD